MAQPRVELRVLGGFDVVVDGEPAGEPWPTRRALELVQLLAISPGHRLVRDEVIEALWPHLPADAGAANLRKAAHLARRALGDDEAIVLRQRGVALYPHAKIDSDLATFQAAAQLALEATDPDMARAVAAMYGGELLPSARYEDWSRDPRDAAAQCHLDLLRLAGRWDLVVENDPTDEGATRAAMRTAIADGQRHRAIALYGRLRQALRDELGVGPSRETEELYRTTRVGLVPAQRSIIGRHRELATIDELLADANGGAELIVLRGPAGIGKSALTRELMVRADQAGWLTFSVAADDPNDAYATLAALLERLAAGQDALVNSLDPRSRAVLGVLIPLAGGTDRLDLPLTRHQMLGATQRLIAAVAKGRGVVIVIDDIDRSDQSSLEVLTLLGDLSLGRLIVAVTLREPTTNRALDRALGRASRIRVPIVMPLDELDIEDAKALARAIDPEIDDVRLSAVVARSEGVPFFVVELAGSRDEKVIDQGIHAAIEARFVNVAEHEVAWLRRLATAGGPLDLEALVALTGCEEAEVDPLLDHAIEAGVLVVDDGNYRFRHEIVRTALAEQLPPHQQAAVHRDAASRLAELGARPGRVAGHWVKGHRPAEAADWFVRAAEEAIRLGGYAAAVAHVDEALTRIPDHPTALRRRAQALDALGDPQALAAYDAAIAVASPEDVHELRPLQALAQIKGGDPRGALITVADTEPRQLESQLARALTLSGAALLGATGPQQGTELSAAGRELALRSGDPAAVVVAAWSQAAAAHARGELRESLRVDLADTRALPLLAVTVFDGQLCITQRLLYGNRPYDDVIRFTNEFAAEASRIGAARGVAFATTLRGEAELLCGRLHDADRDLHEGARLHRRINAPTGESFSFQRLAELAHVRHQDDDARRLLDQALDIARSSGVGFHLLDRIYGTRIQLARSPNHALEAVMEAEEAVRGPFETCPGCRITLEVPAAIAAAQAGDLTRLDEYEKRCTFLAEVVMRLPAWDAALEEVRAHRCLAHGDVAGAADRFTAAAAGFRRVGQPFDAKRCTQQAKRLSD